MPRPSGAPLVVAVGQKKECCHCALNNTRSEEGSFVLRNEQHSIRRRSAFIAQKKTLDQKKA
eukprot:13338170-Alexandrium_andersonii.AAC.1